MTINYFPAQKISKLEDLDHESKAVGRVIGVAGSGSYEHVDLEVIEGPAGENAYQLAVAEGFEGTLEEWIASLKGEDGKPGSDADATAAIEAHNTSGTAHGDIRTAVAGKENAGIADALMAAHEDATNPHNQYALAASMIAALAGKADEVHAHAIADVIGLLAALNAKFDKSGGQISGNLRVSGSMLIGGSDLPLVPGGVLRFVRDDGDPVFWLTRRDAAGNIVFEAQVRLASDRLSFVHGTTGVEFFSFNPSTGFRVNHSTFRLMQKRTPASSAAPGQQGEICYDDNYLYVCVATNTWKRFALSTW